MRVTSHLGLLAPTFLWLDNANTTSWVKENQQALEGAGSTLEFVVCRQRFLQLLTSGEPHAAQAGRMYAATELNRFHSQHLSGLLKWAPGFVFRGLGEQASYGVTMSRGEHSIEIRRLSGALLFVDRLAVSPYADLGGNSSW